MVGSTPIHLLLAFNNIVAHFCWEPSGRSIPLISYLDYRRIVSVKHDHQLRSIGHHSDVVSILRYKPTASASHPQCGSLQPSSFRGLLRRWWLTFGKRCTPWTMTQREASIKMAKVLDWTDKRETQPLLTNLIIIDGTIWLPSQRHGGTAYLFQQTSTGLLMVVSLLLFC